jgi:phage tail-like protein
MSDPTRPTYLVLDGLGSGWNAAALENVEATRTSLGLAPLPSPAVPLVDAAGAFGGMENPTGVAVAANGDLYVSDTATHRVFRIRGCGSESCLDYLPCLGGEGTEPRKFRSPRGLAVSRDQKLYVADSGNDRIQVFDLPSLKLTAMWGGFKSPSDVAVDGKGNVWIADRGNARLRRRDCRLRRFTTIDGTAVAAHFFEVNYGPDARQRFVYLPLRGRLEQWRTAAPAGAADIRVVAQNIGSVADAAVMLAELLHAKGARRLFLEWDGLYPAALESGAPLQEPSDLAILGDGRVAVIDRASSDVRILDAEGRLLRLVRVGADLGGAFTPAAIAADAGGRLLLAGKDGVHRFLVDGRPAYDGKAAEWIGACGGMSVDDRGRLFATAPGGVSEIAASPGFEKSGAYRSRAFDSGIDRCAWDRIAVTFGGGTPATTTATIETFTSNDALSDPDVAALDGEQWRAATANATDFLVLSPPGRYLWLRIRFSGDGLATPLVERIQVHYPRASYLQYLPAIYQADAVSRDVLHRFLRIFQTIFESFEAKIDGFAGFLDPDGTPSSFVEWLAGWIAMTFDASMEEEVRRKLLRHAPELYRIRGTPAGIQRFLSLAFGIDARILEHFRLRKWAFLGTGAALGTRTQLWGKGITPRLQLDVFSRIGEAALISTGDPLHDPFAVHAHKFSVFVPAPVLRSPATVAAVRTLIEREKPAHAQFELVPVEPRFRLGVQSTLGLDSVIGTYPRLVLGDAANLGFNTLLGGAPQPRTPPPMVVGRRSRVGVNSVVG